MPLTTFVDQLRTIEGRGHAGRLPHPSDGRSYRVVLTASGRDAHGGANAGFEAAHRAFMAALPAGEDRPRQGLEDIRIAAERVVASGVREPVAGRRWTQGR